MGRRGALTVVVVNKATTAVRTSLALRHARTGRKATAFRYAGGRIHPLGAVRVRQHRVRLTLPAASVTLVRVPVRS